MDKQVFDAIKCWASKPTWFSSHPSDTKNLCEAIRNLRQLEFNPTEDLIKAAILQHVSGHTKMLGTPENIESTVCAYVSKILGKI